MNVLNGKSLNMVIDCNKKLLKGSLRAKNTRISINNNNNRAYEDAINALNNLQPNAVTVQLSINRHNNSHSHVKDAEIFFNRTDIILSDLNDLSVIHVSGTKGKGSTCALTESILRRLNVKTGFYSSPHLVSVTERIRINGQPISKRLFSKYFWKIHDALEAKQEHSKDMPTYFGFLTIMAYYVFLKEKVDVAVIEVGIGGEHDCTNLIRNTKTVGITSLGLEHVSLLGNTYEQIAWQKGGIIKEKSDAYTTQEQKSDCIRVLNERAIEKNANLHIVPTFVSYKFPNEIQYNEIVSNPSKKLNVSLAIQLCYDWIRKNAHKITDKDALLCAQHSNHSLIVPKIVSNAIYECLWPGRCQCITYKSNQLFIDGAHTTDSMLVCVNWFNNSTKVSNGRQYLLFNVTGERNGNDLLKLIHDANEFDEALFTPNISSFNNQCKDNTHTLVQQNKSDKHSEFWNSLSPKNRSKAFSCISDAFAYLDTIKMDKNEQFSILITGSLHLIGEVMRTIQVDNNNYININNNDYDGDNNENVN